MHLKLTADFIWARSLPSKRSPSKMSDMCYDARERHLAEQQDRASGLKTEYKYFF